MRNHAMSKTNRPQTTLETLKALGYSLPVIRQVLFPLEGIQQKDVAKDLGISTAAVTHIVNGRRNTPATKVLIAGVFHMDPEIMFPPETDAA